MAAIHAESALTPALSRGRGGNTERGRQKSDCGMPWPMAASHEASALTPALSRREREQHRARRTEE